MTKQYVKRVGKEIYDTNSNPFLLKGVGIGGWLLFEGYMFKSFNDIDRPRRFKELVSKKTSKEYYDYFFETLYDTFFTEDDIVLIKKKGFNSIRIALDYQYLFHPSETSISLEENKKNINRLDKVIALCDKHNLYVILDLHAAPGGQTGTNIDNSENDIPALFVNKLYQDQLCYIWKFLATRYKQENIIAAYDLLNEPLPNWNNQYNHLLIPLYKRVIQEIRQVDPHHMITLEGLHWSTDWSCFTERLDENILLQFHKYWSNPDIESIKEYLDIRDTLSVPIFMGEGGENNLQWYYSVFKLYEQLNISYNFWTYKKMDTHNSVISFEKPTKWDQFLKGTLSKEESISTLNELLKNITYKNSKVNHDVVNHLLQKNTLTIPAYGFDYYGTGISVSNNYHNTSIRKSDGIRIVNLDNNIIEPNFKQYGGEDYDSSNQLQVNIEKDEWITYSFEMDPCISRFTINLNPISENICMYINDTLLSTNTYYRVHKDETTYRLKLKALKSQIIKNILIESYKDTSFI